MLGVATLTAGCGGPSQTGPNGMVGRVLGGLDIPERDLVIESLEARDVTDADGKFSVLYKPPEQHVHFTWKGAWYRRVYQPEDEGTDVVLRLPQVRDVDLACQTTVPCVLTVRWQLPSNLEARARAKCAPGQTGHLLGVPAASPSEMTCVAQDAPDREVRDEGSKLIVAEPQRAVTVRVSGPDGPAPECTVRANGDVEPGPDPDSWRVTARQLVTASAICAGRPAVPASVNPLSADAPEELVLVWAPAGPSLDVAGVVDASALWLTAEGPTGWSVRLDVTDGRVLLPPLPAGAYRVAFSDGETLPIGLGPAGPAPAAPGVLLRRTAGGALGMLAVRGDETSALPVTVTEAPAAGAPAQRPR